MRRFCALADATRRTRYLCPSSFGGTSALLPEPDWRLASDHTRTAQKAQAQGLDLSGAAAGHMSVTLHIRSRRFSLVELLQQHKQSASTTPRNLQNNTLKPPYHQQINPSSSWAAAETLAALAPTALALLALALAT